MKLATLVIVFVAVLTRGGTSYTASEAFEKAVKEAKQLKDDPSEEDKLELYALFKQVTVGDNNTERPGKTDITGKALWDAWNAKTGLDRVEADGLYVSKVENLKTELGLLR